MQDTPRQEENVEISNIESLEDTIPPVIGAPYFSTSEYLQLIQSMFGHLGRTGAMTGRMWDVLSQIMEVCQWGNKVPVNQSAIAKSLGTSRQVISRAIQKLVQVGVLVRVRLDKRHPEFYLNPRLAVKGRDNGERQRIRRLYDREFRVEEE
jgi:biotin operon repressor